jgi:hypothetical protein
MRFQIMIAAATLQCVSAAAVASDCGSKLNPDSKYPEVLACLKALENDISDLRNKVNAATAVSGIPARAVVAFDLPDGCPKGWARFERGASRTIIGASATHLAEVLNVGADFKPLRAYPYQADGGSEFHELEADELPSISVGTNGFSAQASTVDRYNAGGSNYPVITASQKPIQTDPLGKGKAFSLMPPFIALYFCIKQSSE